MNKLTINFDLCTPTPEDGYLVYYKPVGSIIAYRIAGPFTSTPIIIFDQQENVLTQFEGYIQSDCGDLLGSQVPFITQAPGIVCKTYDVNIGAVDGLITVNWVDCEGEAQEILRGPNTTTRICAKEGTVTTGSPGNSTINLVGNGCIPPVSYPLYLKISVLPADICSAPVQLLYASYPTLTMDLCQLFYDAGLTMPVTFYNYVVQIAGNVYDLSPDGVVGADSGLVC